MNDIIDIEAVKRILADEGTFHGKYVRISTGEYRFGVSGYFCPNHKDMVKEGEKAETASFVSIRRDGWKVEGHSTTLQLSWDHQDREFFANNFGKEYDDYD